VKISANRDLCKGHGQCELFASEYFEIDDDALVVVLKEDADEADLLDVKDAVAHCPEAALILAD